MEIRAREKEGIIILDVQGRLVGGDACEVLRATVQQRVDGGIKNLILQLGGVEYIDSSGLGTLVVCYSTLRDAEGVLKLLNVTSRNMELLVLTKLETVFETFDDEQDAVNSFFPNRKVQRFDILNFVQQNERENN
jgi:anti-sigma B factor antagonist